MSYAVVRRFAALAAVGSLALFLLQGPALPFGGGHGGGPFAGGAPHGAGGGAHIGPQLGGGWSHLGGVGRAGPYLAAPHKLELGSPHGVLPGVGGYRATIGGTPPGVTPPRIPGWRKRPWFPNPLGWRRYHNGWRQWRGGWIGPIWAPGCGYYTDPCLQCVPIYDQWGNQIGSQLINVC